MKKYEITKEQILEIAKFNNSVDKERRLKQWFPDAFKLELEIGKWYKRPHNKALFCIVGDPENEPFEVYGFDMVGEWMEQNKLTDKKAQTFKDEEIEATESEVFEALKNEAVKRGLKEGVFVKCLYSDRELVLGEGNCMKTGCRFYLDPHNQFWSYSSESRNVQLFNDGQWAEIIPTITKAEAEKLLNKKII